MRTKINDTIHNMTDEFYKLYNEGYIYDEDENGRNMSYGEYAAISDYFWDIVRWELESCYNMDEAYEKWQDLVNSADDDTKMFWGVSEDEESFEFGYDEEEGTYHVYGKCPEPLKPFLDEFEKEAKYKDWVRE